MLTPKQKNAKIRKTDNATDEKIYFTCFLLGVIKNIGGNE